MPVRNVTLEDLFQKMGDTKDDIQKEIRDTSKELGGRLGNVETAVAGLSATVKAQGREIGDVKTGLRDHINKPEPTGVVMTPPAPRSPASGSSWPPGRIRREFFKMVRFWGAVAAVAGGVVTSILNLLGII